MAKLKCRPVKLPGLKGLWMQPESTTYNAAGVPTYTWTFTVPKP